MNDVNQTKNFQGKLYPLEKNTYEKVMFPFAQTKQIVEIFYDLLLKIIWNELTRGKKIEDELTNLVLFIIFSVFSLISYYLQNYWDIIIIVLILFWNIDFLLAKKQYSSMKSDVKVNLYINEIITYQIISHKKVPMTSSSFEKNSLKHILIQQREIEKGAFQEIVGMIWQMSLIDHADNIYIINENKNFSLVLKSAYKLQNILNKEIIFKDSEGNNNYAEYYLNSSDYQKSQSVQCQYDHNRWYISSGWKLNDFGCWLQKIFTDSGFFLFLLIMSGFTVKFGSLVAYFLRDFLGIKISFLSLYSLGEWFTPNIDFSDWIELIISFGLIIVKGWQLSCKKRIYIDRQLCKFLLNNHQINVLNTQQIQSILLLDQPELSILIFEQKRYIKINNFLHKKEAEEMALKIESAITNLQENDKSFKPS